MITKNTCKIFFKLFFVLFFFTIFFNNAQAATYTAAVSGNWNAPATWGSTSIPGSADDVVIGGNFTVTVPTGTFSCKSIALNGATAGTGTSALIINGSLSTTGAVTITGGNSANRKALLTISSSGNLSVGMDLTLNTGGTGFNEKVSTLTTSGILTVNRDLIIGSGSGPSDADLFIQSGTVEVKRDVIIQGPTGTGFLTFTGNATMNLTGANSRLNPQNFGTLSFGSTNSTINLNSNTSAIVIVGTLDMGTGNSFINLAGTFATGGTFIAGTGTVNYKSSITQTITNLIYYNLTSTDNGPRILSPTGTIWIAKTFTKGTNTYTTTGSTVNFNGTGAQFIPFLNYNNLTISGARTTNSVTLDNSGIIGVAGALTNSSTYTLPGKIINSNSTINFNGNAAQTIIAFPYFHLIVTKPLGIVASTVNNNNIAIEGNCTVNSGTLSVGTGGTVIGQIAEYTFSGNSASSILEVKDGAKLQLIGTSVFPSQFPTGWKNIILNPNSTVDYASSADQTIVARQYGNLMCGASGGTRTLANSGIINIQGSFNPNPFVPANVYTISGSTIEYNGTGAQSIAAFNYNNLLVTNSANNISMNGMVGIAGTFTPNALSFANMANSTVNYNSTGNQTVIPFNYYNLTISENRVANSVTLSPTSLIQVAGALANSSTFLTGKIINTGSTIVYNGSIAQSVIDFPYNNLTINKASNSATLASDLTPTNLVGELNIQSGTLTTGNNNITGTATKNLIVGATGTLNLSGIITQFPTGFSTSTLASTSTVNYSSINEQIIAAKNYGNLKTSNSGSRTLEASGIIKVASNFTTDTNTFVSTGSTVEFNGSGIQNLSGNLGNSRNPLNNLNINNSGTLITQGLILGADLYVTSNLNLLNGYLNLNSKTLTLLNSAGSAITRSNGVILSEKTDNSSKVQWNIGTTAGSHIFPFGKTLSDYIPFTFNLTSGDASNVIVSTYGTAANNSALPPGVTGLDKQGLTDLQNKVVDRFWQIDESVPANTKTATLTFTYSNSEKHANILTPKVQRWGGSSWNAAITGQTTGTNSVSVPGIQSFSPWAIYDNTPPVALFKANVLTGCQGTSVTFTDTSKFNPIGWSWTFPGGTPGTSTAQNPTVAYSTGGNYNVSLTATNGFGSDNKTVSNMINIETPLPAPIVSSNGPVCTGDSLKLSTTSNLSPYIWSGPNGFSSTLKNPKIPLVDASAAGQYTLRVTSALGCLSDLASLNVIVNTKDNPNFNYGTSTICNSGNNLIPTIPNGVSGTFSATPVGLVFVSTSTGEINVSTSLPNTYSISFLTNGVCPSSKSANLTITGNPNADFTYSNSSYCLNEANPSPNYPTSGTPGTFSANSTSLKFVDANTGVIDLKNSSAGTYKVYNSIAASGSCALTVDSIPVTLNPLPNSKFNPARLTACASDGIINLNPEIPGGSFSGTGISGNTFNPKTSGAGTFSIKYTNTLGTCTDSTKINIVVNPLPNTTFSGLITNYCLNNPIVTLTPTTSGGTFLGNGISGNTFNPSAAGVGTHTIKYTVSNSFNCKDTSAAFTVNVIGNPNPNFTGLSANYCTSDPSALMTPTTAGGVFSGPGVSGSNFIPSNAGQGIHSIKYVITNGNNCKDSTIFSVNVRTKPNANFSGLNAIYCLNESASTLTPVKAGGVFYGNGISGNKFDPKIAGAGSHQIKYKIDTLGFCADSTIQTVKVNPMANTRFVGLQRNYCTNSSNVTMVPDSSGGTFKGNGVSGNIFSPSTAGFGQHRITFVINNSFNCKDSSFFDVIVNDLPNADFSGLKENYCPGDKASALQANTSGGVFSGPGIQGFYFNPTKSGPGTFNIVYKVKNSSGCEDSIRKVVTVSQFPESDAGPDVSICKGSSVQIGVVANSKNTYSWSPTTGLSNATISNPIANPNTSTSYTLTVTSPSTCIAIDEVQVNVNPMPNADFSGLKNTYCTSENKVIINPTNPGGIFSGPGINNNYFEPKVAGTGQHIIKYVITNTYGCKDSSSFTLNVYQSPDAKFTGLGSQYCSADPSVELSPYQSGGVFSGQGVVGNMFDPSKVSDGTHGIKYVINNSNCSDSSIVFVSVYKKYNSGFSGYKSIYCINDNASKLIPQTPRGKFIGEGISGNYFDPKVAGVGSKKIKYLIENNGYCSDSTEVTITVNPNPDASFTGLKPEFCLIDSMIKLTPKTTGGIFKGRGILGNNFNPKNAGIGEHKITYSLTNAESCSDSISIFVKVNSMSDADFSGLEAAYCERDSAITLSPKVAGGFFNGPGINGNIFNSIYAGEGTHTITYTIKNSNKCESIRSQSITIFPYPIADAGFDIGICEGLAQTIGTPAVPGYTYLWTPSTGLNNSTSAQPLASPNVSTNYKLTVTSNGLCSSMDSVVVSVVPAPKAEFGFAIKDKQLIVNGSAINGVMDWEWNFGDGSQKVKGQNAVHNYAICDNFQVKLVVKSFCGMDSIIQTITTCKDTTFVLGIDLPIVKERNTYQVNPNPFIDIINIEMNIVKSTKLNIQLFNELGANIYVSEFSNLNRNPVLGKSKLSIDLKKNNLPSGLYLLRVIDNNESKTFKLSKLR